MPRISTKNLVAHLLAMCMLLAIASCGSDDNNSISLINGEFSIAYVKRPINAIGNPTDGITFQSGGDLYLRDLSSPSAEERNITRAHTQGKGDVSDPEVSFDAKTLTFAMRGPDDPTWNIWEYTLASGSLTRVIADDDLANQGDDVDPAYLPDGKIVFSSNRQQTTRNRLVADNQEHFAYLDEYQREPAIVLHTMSGDGSDIQQISFNQSHDRNPTVLTSGEIMYSRWDHLGSRNQFTIFFTNPDGTSLFVLYGAHSPGNSFLHPREMQNGRVISSLMPLSGTHEGGGLVTIDIQNYSEHDDPAPGVESPVGGQFQTTPYDVNIGGGLSRFGRYTTPYPLWDGTNRVLVSWTPSQPTNSVDPISGKEKLIEGDPVYGVYLLDMDEQTLRPVALAPNGFAVTDPVAILARATPNVISEKIFDAELLAENKGILNVKSVYDTDKRGRMDRSVLTDQESIPVIPPAESDNRSAIADIAMLKDPLQITATARPARFVRVTAAVPTPPGLSREIIGETEFEMQRILGYAEVEPDGSFKIKVPADTPVSLAVLDSEGRAFIPHTSWLQVRPGETRTCNGCHSPRRGSAINKDPIAGNHPPLFGLSDDGSINIHPGVSANGTLFASDPDGDVLTFRIVTPPTQGTVVLTDDIAGTFVYTAAVDAAVGQDSFQFVANDGTADSNVATVRIAIHEPPTANRGESQAETRVRHFPEVADLQPDPFFRDVWGPRANPCRTYRYTGNVNCNTTPEQPLASEDLTTPTPTDGFVNYLDHIQPLWSKDRGSNTCINCHNDTDPNNPSSVGIDLRTVITGTGRVASYQSLMVGKPALDADGLPIIDVDNNGEVRIRRETPLVIPGTARSSHLIEKLFETELRAESNLETRIFHGNLLNRAEKRLVVEWIDVGGQYYNDPYGEDSNANGIKELTEVRGTLLGLDGAFFNETIHPILMARCADCHRPSSIDNDVDPTPNPNFQGSRFVLTGQREGDFNVTRAMVNDLSSPATSYLLSRPASDGVAPNPNHPTIASRLDANIQTPVLSPSAPADRQVVNDYQAIFDWINAARTANGR